jgi:pyruvate kinase
MMARIVVDAERNIQHDEYNDRRKQRRSKLTISETICEAAAHASDDLALRAVALFTESGFTARKLSKYHPSAPIFAFSPNEVTINRLNLLWGTKPILCPKLNSNEAMVECAENLLEEGGHVKTRDVIAIVAGTRTKSGSTNFLRLHVMGDQKEVARFSTTREATVVEELAVEEAAEIESAEITPAKPKRGTSKSSRSISAKSR